MGRPKWGGGPPKKKINRENLKFGLKFSLLNNFRLTLLREEFRLPELILHSDLRRRAASRLALPCPSSWFLFSWDTGYTDDRKEQANNKYESETNFGRMLSN